MADTKDLLQVLWSGADVLRGKMDANEYKTLLVTRSRVQLLPRLSRCSKVQTLSMRREMCLEMPMNPPYSAKWSAAEGFKQDELKEIYASKYVSWIDILAFF